MKKKELRNLYKQKRKELPSAKRETLSDAIFVRFFENFKVLPGQKIHVFLPIARLMEVNTLNFIKDCQKIGATVYVPKIKEDHLISISLTNDTVLKKNTWGILEPAGFEGAEVADFDYVITPLLYCDSFGNRVGYGKGFYDKFFKTLKSSTLKVGINFFSPNALVDDPDENDIPLDYLVTPTEVLSFDTGSL